MHDSFYDVYIFFSLFFIGYINKNKNLVSKILVFNFNFMMQVSKVPFHLDFFSQSFLLILCSNLH